MNDNKHTAKAVIMGLCSRYRSKRKNRLIAFGALAMAEQLQVLDADEVVMMHKYIKELTH